MRVLLQSVGNSWRKSARRRLKRQLLSKKQLQQSNMRKSRQKSRHVATSLSRLQISTKTWLQRRQLRKGNRDAAQEELKELKDSSLSSLSADVTRYQKQIVAFEKCKVLNDCAAARDLLSLVGLSLTAKSHVYPRKKGPKVNKVQVVAYSPSELAYPCEAESAIVRGQVGDFVRNLMGLCNVGGDRTNALPTVTVETFKPLSEQIVQCLGDTLNSMAKEQNKPSCDGSADLLLLLGQSECPKDAVVSGPVRDFLASLLSSFPGSELPNPFPASDFSKVTSELLSSIEQYRTDCGNVREYQLTAEQATESLASERAAAAEAAQRMEKKINQLKREKFKKVDEDLQKEKLLKERERSVEAKLKHLESMKTNKSLKLEKDNAQHKQTIATLNDASAQQMEKIVKLKSVVQALKNEKIVSEKTHAEVIEEKGQVGKREHRSASPS